MSMVNAKLSVARIAEHVWTHNLVSLQVVLHGGEPLLAGAAFREDLAWQALSTARGPIPSLWHDI